MNYSECTVFVEIPKGGNQKYEYCKDTKTLVLDRVLQTPFVYPLAYGFILDTLGPDGDELDALIYTTDTTESIKAGSTYKCKIIGALLMRDEGGDDPKLICVLSSNEEDIKLNDTPLESIRYFFANYKNGELNRYSKVEGFVDSKVASSLYESSLL